MRLLIHIHLNDILAYEYREHWGDMTDSLKITLVDKCCPLVLELQFSTDTNIKPR